MEIRQIIILTWIPISRREAEWLQLNWLEEEGFRVKIFDLSKILHSVDVRSNLDTHQADDKYIHKIESFLEFDAVVAQATHDSIFIDLLQGIGEIQWRFERVFRILKKHKARYFIIHADGYPCLAPTGRQIWLRFKKVFSPRLLMQFLARKVATQLRKKGVLYPLPTKVLATQTTGLKAFVSEYQIPEQSIWTLNHPDYYDWLRFSAHIKKEGVVSSLNLPPRFCVFIDDAQTHHPDYAIMKMKPMDNEKYLASMNKFFRFIEDNTGIPLLIAGHPRPQYDDFLNIFDGRRIIQGKTMELVANSELTIVSYSTAASFAVLFDKPLIVLTNNELLKAGRVGFDEPIARCLGLEVINADDDSAINRMSLEFENWNKALYRKYISDWLRFREDDLPLVQVLINGIRDMNRQYAENQEVTDAHQVVKDDVT